MEKIDEAVEILNQCKNMVIKHLGNGHFKLGKTYEVLGKLYARNKEFGTSLEYLEKAEEINGRFNDKKVGDGEVGATMGLIQKVKRLKAHDDFKKAGMKIADMNRFNNFDNGV